MMDLPDDPNIQSGNVTGSVTANAAGDRENSVFVRFLNDNGSTGSLRVVKDYPAPDNFTYLVPALPQSSLVVAATSGLYSGGPFSVAFRDNVAPGQNVSLEVPTAPIPLLPNPGAMGVDTSTEFSWTGSAGVYLVSFIDQDFYRGAFVVTSSNQTNLPAFSGFALNANGEHHWRVETHGSYDDMDAAAGPTGYLQAIVDDDVPAGPRRGDGTFTISTWFQMFTAP